MMLPKVPAGRAKTKRQTVGFLGFNLSEGASEGEFRETKNLSARKFPGLSPRCGREKLTGYTSPSALYAWNGLVAVDGTSLKIDGEPVATVSPGEKQFAVVNTKLCIFPDKVCLDLTKNELMPLGPSTTSKPGTTVTFTASSLTIEPDELIKTATERLYDEYLFWEGGGHLYDWSYIKEYTDVEWNSATGTWTLTGEVERRAKNATVGRYVMLKKTDMAGSYQLNYKRIEREREESGEEEVVTVYDYTDNNTDGYYAKITNIVIDTLERAAGDADRTTLTLEIRNGAQANDRLTRLFKVGDRVTISGADNRDNNIEKKAITALTDTTMSFAADTFTAGTGTNQLTVTRPVPDLDYVCESQNRLWGVSKADNTIYASALGDPTNFYVYDGTSLDSYAVAVGSEGAFTAICKYDRSVLCFKENTLHRVYGDYPAEYSATERPVFGVKDGAAGSLTGIGSVLYYLGRDGVYAFSGNTPTLISGAFGEKRFTRGYSGTAGDILYMSLEDTSGVWGLYTYDTRKGIWLREDGTFALAFAAVNGDLHYVNGLEARITALTAPVTPASGAAFTWTEGTAAADYTFANAAGPLLYDNMTVVSVKGGGVSFDAAYTGTDEAGNGLWTLTYHGTGDGAAHEVTDVVMTYELVREEAGDAIYRARSSASDEAVAWEALLTPFTEGTLRSKSPSKLTLRCELAAGAWIAAEVSCDNEPFRQVFTSAGRGEPTLVIPIAPRRCDAWRLRLSGQGDCVIRAIEREFRIGR